MHKYVKTLIHFIEHQMDGRSQTWLVEHTGIKKSKMSRLLAGKNEPTLSDIVAIAGALGISASDLLLPLSQDIVDSETKMNESELLILFRQAGPLASKPILDHIRNIISLNQKKARPAGSRRA